MRKTKNIISVLLAVLMIGSAFFCGGLTTAFAATIKTGDMTVTFGQTEARAMLASINDLRRPGNAWYYDQSNSRVSPTDLKGLTYDYKLEEFAMQRAAEIAVYFSHTRPDLTDCFSVYEGRFMAKGENIAMGFRTGDEVFEAWCETNDDYSGQGHRRNMLGANFTCVGIGHAILNGTHYWVQEFGSPATGAAYTDPVDTVKTVTIRYDADNFTLPEARSERRAGDVNGDGNVLADDARLALRASAQLQRLNAEAKACADVDGDGTVRADDARQILRYSAGLQRRFTRSWSY